MFSPNSLMNPYDSFWWQMQHPTFLMYINYLFSFREPVDYDKLLAVLENRLLAYSRFRKRVTTPRLTLGHPVWEEIPNFDLHHYVHRIAAPQPGDRATLIDLLNHLTSRPFDPRRSPWEMYLIEGAEPGPLLLGRMHHCIADGIALMNLLNVVAEEDPAHSEQMLDRAEMNRAIEEEEHWLITPSTTLEPIHRLAKRNPMGLVKAARTGIGMGLALARVVARRPDKGGAYKEGLGPTKVLDWTAPFDLGEIHTVEDAAGVTVNDMFMTIIAGGLRRYWLGRGWPVDEGPVRTVMPFNVRPSEDAHDLGNGFGVTMPELLLEIADPVQRLIRMHEQLGQIKRSHEATAALATMGVIGIAPTPIPDLFNGFMRTKVTTVITNLPGPATPRYLAGSEIEDIIFWVPAGLFLPIGISIFSYRGAIRVGVVTDEQIAPDPAKLAADIEAEWAEMRAAFGIAKQHTSSQLEVAHS